MCIRDSPCTFSGVGHEYTSRTFSCGSFGFALVLVDAAGRESRELDELEPRELKELWATAVGAMAAMASTAAVAKWKVFID